MRLGWNAAAAAVALAALLPVAALAAVAAQGSVEIWEHLAVRVLPVAARETAILLAGVALVVATVGTLTAWLAAAYDFPGRKWLEWALLLPLAVPTYIVAYAYLDLLHPVGPVQEAIRAVLGYSSAREFRLPDVRSMTGCVLLLGFVLYPYVYLTARAMFLTQAADLLDVARTLGAGPGETFRRVALPLARPAIAVGTALALMEALNDVGASEFLGVRTLTLSVYSAWVNRADLAGAAQIALAMLAFVVALVALERLGRGHRGYAGAGRARRTLERRPLEGPKAALAALACALPVAIGFAAPASYLIHATAVRIAYAGVPPTLWTEARNTVTVAATATLVILAAGVLCAHAARTARSSLAARLPQLGALGYAVPGTVLAIGALVPIAAFDRSAGAALGFTLLGSGAALVYAYAARFLAIALGGMEAGLKRIPASLDAAARTLGQPPGGVLRRIHLPLARPALAAAGLLAFVDCAKELPATLLLRPLNFETLATHLYGEAARGTYEDGAIAALLIVAIGCLPVALLARLGRT